MSLDYDRFYESKVKLLGSCMDGHHVWSLLARNDIKYKLARMSTGILKYYNQGVKVMTAHEFNKEKQSGIITVYPEEYKPSTDIVIMFAVSSTDANLEYPNMFKRGRMVGFVYSLTNLVHNGRTITPEMIKLMKVHSATFSASTGQVTVQVILPKTVAQQESDGTEFIIEKIKDWIKYTNAEINHTMISQLHEKNPEKLTKLVKYLLDVLGVNQPTADWLRLEIKNMLGTTDKPWSNPQYKVYADNAWLMIEDHLRPKEYTREDFMERWRVEADRGAMLENMPLQERLKELTEDDVRSFCWWMSEVSYGSFVDWRLCLTIEEVNSLKSSNIEQLSLLAVQRWRDVHEVKCEV